MPKLLPNEYFENEAERNQIEQAVLSVIPEGAYYHNIVRALCNVLKDMTWEMTKKAVFTKSTKSKSK